MGLLPLGTVIQIGTDKAFIIGYSSAVRGGTELIGYFVTSYPLGFTSIEKVAFVPHDYEYSVVAEGYKTEFSEKLLDVLSKSFDLLQHNSVEDIEELNRFLKGCKDVDEEDVV